MASAQEKGQTMSASSTGPDRKARRAFAWIATVAIVLALILSGAWYYLASRLDAAVRNAIAAAAGRGITIVCPNQHVFGYPFRLGLHCDSFALDAPAGGLHAAGGILRTAAQLYRPNRVVAELGAPLAVSTPDGARFDLDWTLAQASAAFWTAGLDHFALVLDKPVLAVAAADGASAKIAGSDHLEVHARRNGDDLDFAMTDTGIRALVPELSQAPLFDAAIDATIDGAADWLSGELPGQTLREALAGKSGTLRALKVALPGVPSPASADFSGPFRVDREGVISGDFTLAVTDPRTIAGLVAALSPRAAGIAGSIASGIAFAGRTENGRTVIRLTVAEGKASLGIIPLGRIPPLR